MRSTALSMILRHLNRSSFLNTSFFLLSFKQINNQHLFKNNKIKNSQDNPDFKYSQFDENLSIYSKSESTKERNIQYEDLACLINPITDRLTVTFSKMTLNLENIGKQRGQKTIFCKLFKLENNNYNNKVYASAKNSKNSKNKESHSTMAKDVDDPNHTIYLMLSLHQDKYYNKKAVITKFSKKLNNFSNKIENYFDIQPISKKKVHRNVDMGEIIYTEHDSSLHMILHYKNNVNHYNRWSKDRCQLYKSYL